MITVSYMALSSSDPTSFYRASGPFGHIHHPDIEFKNITGLPEYNWSTICGSHILFLQRPFAEAHIALIKLAKDMNMKVITDYDDDLLNVPSHNNTSLTYEEQKSNTKMCLHLSDEVWVTTPALKQSYKPFNRNIHILPNCHNDYLFPVTEKKPFNVEGKTAVYRGGPSHEADLYQSVNDIAETINENLDWRFVFMGMEYKLIFDRTSEKNTFYVPPQTIVQFYKYLHETNPNICLFPLLDNKFNRAKSNISLLESTYAGAAFMGPKCLPEFDHQFVEDIHKGLHYPFEELSRDYEKMKKMNEMSWDWICSERLLSDTNKIRVERLLNI